MRRTTMLAILALTLGVGAAFAATPGWTQLGPFDQAAGAPVRTETVVAVPGASTLYAGGAGGVFRSDDAGAHWVALGQPGGNETSRLVLDPSAPGTVYAATNKGVFKTTDAGGNWAPSGLEDQAVYALAVDPTSPQTLYAGTWPANSPGGATGYLFKSHDAGAGWSQVYDLHNDIVISLGVDPRDTSTVFAGSQSGSVLRSGNAGLTWAPVDFVAGAVSQVVPDPVRAGVVYSRWGASYVILFPPAGNLRQSLDGGANWSDVSGLPSVYSGPFLIDPNDPNVFYSMTDGSLYRSRDGGESWSVIASAPASGELAMTAGDPRYVYAAGEGVRRLDVAVLPPTCEADATTLCLQFGHFSARLFFTGGPLGLPVPMPAVPVTSESGYFWFFGPDNVEVMVKILDGTAINDRFWVIYGSLSDVAYTLRIADNITGETKDYVNPAGALASVADTDAFPNAVSATSGGVRPTTALVLPSLAIACEPEPTVLCLNDGRFQVRVAWRRSEEDPSADGFAVPLTADTGYLWFFGESNVELVVKVLDGTGVNGHFWVFYGALSNVEYTITVTDTLTGATRTYENPQGTLASVADTGAF